MNLATVYYNMGSYDSSLFYAKYALAKITQSTSRATAIKVLYIRLLPTYTVKKTNPIA